MPSSGEAWLITGAAIPAVVTRAAAMLLASTRVLNDFMWVLRKVGMRVGFRVDLRTIRLPHARTNGEARCADAATARRRPHPEAGRVRVNPHALTCNPAGATIRGHCTCEV